MALINTTDSVSVIASLSITSDRRSTKIGKNHELEKNNFHNSKWNYLLFADKIQTFMKIMMMKKRQYRFIKTPFNVVFILKGRHAQPRGFMRAWAP